MSALSKAQAAAVNRFAAKHGRTWKAALRRLWLSEGGSTDDEAALRQVRNTLGPLWLSKAKVPAYA